MYKPLVTLIASTEEDEICVGRLVLTYLFMLVYY